ncbi:hypothetical protein HK102_002432 [Quaeritorhiza haematococci]|nr:hypothetical protein HK102_002432 [Quaeritorhiza haematococci]
MLIVPNISFLDILPPLPHILLASFGFVATCYYLLKLNVRNFFSKFTRQSTHLQVDQDSNRKRTDSGAVVGDFDGRSTGAGKRGSGGRGKGMVEGTPRPEGTLPILGDFVTVWRNMPRINDFIAAQTLHFTDPTTGLPKTWCILFPFGMEPWFFIGTPQNVEWILKTKLEKYVKGQAMKEKMGDFFGNGIFTVDGDLWKIQRKAMANIFTTHRFKEYVRQTFASKMEVVIAKLGEVAAAARQINSNEKLAKGEKDVKGVIDLQDLFARFTFDAFCLVGFGHDPHSLDAPLTSPTPFAVSFDRAQRWIDFRFMSPFWKIAEFFFGKQQRDDIAYIRNFAMEIVEERMKQLEGSNGMGESEMEGMGEEKQEEGQKEVVGQDAEENQNDLLSFLIRSLDAQKKELGSELGGGDDAFKTLLCDEVINAMIAGRDTTAQALSWTFYLLDQNPRVEERLLKEIDDVLGGSQGRTTGKGGDGVGGLGEEKEKGESEKEEALKRLDRARSKRITYEDIMKMKYALAVFMETLRLYPSVPKDFKYAAEDDVLPDGTFIPAGSRVIFSPYAMGRHPSIWSPDAATFRPERWFVPSTHGQSQPHTDSSSATTACQAEHQRFLSPSAFEFPVFNAGPRICLGKRLAEIEGVFVMVSILRRFRVKVVDPSSVWYANSLTMPMVRGLKVVVEER